MGPQDTNQVTPTPTPTPTPEQPAPAPVPPVSTPAPAPAPAGPGISKKTIILISSIAGGVLILVIALVIVLSLFTVSKDDFNHAYEAANDTRSAYSKMVGSSYVSVYSTDTERKNKIDTLKEASKEFNDGVDKLSKEKAVQRDGEAAKLFKDFEEKKGKFDTAMDAVVEAYEYIVPALGEASSSSGRDSTDVAKIKQAFSDIKDKVKDSNNKEFVNKMIPLLGTYETALKQYEGYLSGNSPYNSSYYTQVSNASRDISNAQRDWSSNLSKLGEDAEINKEFNKLGEYLASKSSGR